ncbi:MAG: hypothetical protein H0X33_01050 [Taibaiella sp.]|nr:hypothetical protein [Taibaiella sp.]
MRKRPVLYIIGCIIVISVVCIAMLYNKPHRKAENEKGIAITAPALCQAYQANENSANAQYLNKTLQVTGKVNNIKTNQDGATVAELEGDNGLVVLCTMRNKKENVTASANVTVKGFCSSNTMLDVLLTDCILIIGKDN